MIRGRRIIKSSARNEFSTRVENWVARDRGREKQGVSERILYGSLRIHRTFPILHARAELTWAHYRARGILGENVKILKSMELVKIKRVKGRRVSV